MVSLQNKLLTICYIYDIFSIFFILLLLRKGRSREIVMKKKLFCIFFLLTSAIYCGQGVEEISNDEFVKSNKDEVEKPLEKPDFDDIDRDPLNITNPISFFCATFFGFQNQTTNNS